MKDSDKRELDREKTAYGIVVKGQYGLGIDYILIVDYMLQRGFSPKVINSSFSVYAGRPLLVTRRKQ